MAVFIDTSALYAALAVGDANHLVAGGGWVKLAEQRETAVTTNYVLLETTAETGHRLQARDHSCCRLIGDEDATSGVVSQPHYYAHLGSRVAAEVGKSIQRSVSSPSY